MVKHTSRISDICHNSTLMRHCTHRPPQTVASTSAQYEKQTSSQTVTPASRQPRRLGYVALSWLTAQLHQLLTQLMTLHRNLISYGLLYRCVIEFHRLIDASIHLHMIVGGLKPNFHLTTSSLDRFDDRCLKSEKLFLD